MSTVVRGLRNILRNATRSLLVVLLVAVSVAVFVAMSQTHAATSELAARLRTESATLIQVTPPGVPAGGGGEITLPQAWAADIKRIPNVVRVETYLRKQFWDNSKQFAMGALTGVEPGATLRLSAMGGFTGSPRLIEGRALSPEDSSQPVAVIGQVFARQQNVRVGDELVLSAAILRGRGRADPNTQALRARVVGVFSTGVVYGDNQIFVPLDIAQRALGKPGQATGFAVTASQAEYVTQVEAAIKALLEGRADVLSEKGTAQLAAESMDQVSRSTLLTAMASAVVAALVIFLTMALVTRERTHEIGVLKAIGASDAHVAFQFAAETVGIAALGGLLGIGIAAVAGSGLIAMVSAALGAPPAVQLGFSVPPRLTAGAFGLAVAIGVLGSLYPAIRAARLRPSEALRGR